jgi:hypothetical protein
VRLPGQRAEETRKPGDLAAEERDSITYLTGMARRKFKPSGLNSLENNVIVVEILQAARDSVKTGRKVAIAAR